MRAGRVKLAALLWLVLAFLVWNVVFDRLLVLAGRRYSYAAAMAARRGDSFLTIDDWMRPALHRAFVVASGSAGVVAGIGLLGIALAARRELLSSRPDARLSPPPEPR